jgi:hypothetical protein
VVEDAIVAIALEFGFVLGHDSFIDGGVLGFEAVVQEVYDVQGFTVEVYGKAVYSSVAAFYDDGVLPPRGGGFRSVRTF